MHTIEYTRPWSWRSCRATLLLLLLAALPFLPTLGAPFFADDYLHIERLDLVRPGLLAEALRSWILRAADTATWWTPPDLAIPYFRPLVTLSFFLDHALWGLHAAGYHLTNLLLHLGSTLLCLGIARRVLKTDFGAWAAAALFALHPCHTEAMAWISGRTDLLAGFFCAAALYCHLRGLRAGVLVCFALGLCAKEMALTLAPIVLGYELLFPPRRRLAMPMVLVAMAAVYLVLRRALLGAGVPPHPYAHGPGDPDMLRQLVTAVPLYLADLFFFIPAEPVLTYPFWMRHLLLLVPLCLFLGVGLRDALRQSADPAASRFALLWVGLALLPVLPVTVGERFLYWPSFGYALLVGAKLPRVPRPARPALIYAALTLAVVLGKGWYFVDLSRSSRQVVEDALVALDRAPRARQLLVADLPAQSALAFAHAVRLYRPERPLQVEVLSIAPHFTSVAPDFRSAVERTADGLAVRAEGRPYLSSYIEQAYLAQRPPLRAGEIVRRPGLRVEVLATAGAGLTSFAVHFDSQEERLILRGRGLHLYPL